MRPGLVATELFPEQREKGGGCFSSMPSQSHHSKPFWHQMGCYCFSSPPSPTTNKRDNKKTYYVVAFKIERELSSLVYLLRDLYVILMSE